MAPVPMILSDL